jgi:deoxyribodipyrimidine photo-lyase
MLSSPIVLFWFRRDLRVDDNAALYHALRSGYPVLPLFIFDTDILDKLSDRRDARVAFIHQALARLKERLRERGSDLLVQHGRPLDVWEKLLQTFPVAAVYANRDYEPYALRRDTAVRVLLERRGIPMHTYKDHVVFEKDEVLKEDGKPYTVFTPYSRKWRAKLAERLQADGNSFYLASYPCERYFDRFLRVPQALPFPSLEDIGFVPAGIPFPPDSVPQGLIRNYDKTRNFPAIAGTSRLGVHFRFGTISIREKARRAQQLNDTFLNELIWRDFYSQILAHFPHVVERPFRPEYERIPWRDAPEEFRRWCEGTTGYPLVDAGMRELNTTGYMHNRVRMVTASFLTKHLLIDWRLGEAYFAQKLLDFDLASNNGGWQWAAGCGTDAAPYFRIFNPIEQAKKFDPDAAYVRKWIPELGTSAYPKPIVDHTFARQRCLQAFKAALSPAV